MSRKRTQVPDTEPIGIVISRGAEQELAPTVTAFVWGPVDYSDEDAPELVAA